jgi:succinoglycan biosynthesis protein ExoA
LNHPIRILHLRASNFVGGPERQLLRYASYEYGDCVETILGTFVSKQEGREFAEEVRRQGIKAHVLPDCSARKILSQLTELLRKEPIELVCTHGYKADILGTIAARTVGIPVVCFLRGWTAEDWKVQFYELLDRAALLFADRIVCLSETQARQFSTKPWFSGRTRVVLNAIDDGDVTAQDRSNAQQVLRRRFRISNVGPIVAAAGRLSPEKGTAHFIDAIPAIRTQAAHARFVIFGDGPLKAALQAKSQRLGLDDVLCFTGHLPDFLEVLPGIDVLVNPSLSEVMPNVVLESMALGVPVLATDVGGVGEIAGKEKAVCLIPPGNSKSLAQGVIGLLRDPERRQQLGRAGRDRTRTAFGSAKQRCQLRSLYAELIPQFAALQERSARSSQSVNLPEDASPAEPRRAALLPLITIVVPVRNEAAHLRNLLKDLLAQEYPTDRYEIIVADGKSTDGTPEITKEFESCVGPRVVLVQNPKRLSSAGRNVGVRTSRGEIIIFIDGHCRVSNRKLLAEVFSLMEETGADCLCRPQPLAAPDNTWFQNVVARVRTTFLGHGPESTIYVNDFHGFVDPTSSGAIYKRSIFDRFGFFDERFDACEDVEFNYRVFRAGLRSYLSSRLAVSYKARSKPGALFRQLFRYGRGRFRFMRKHPDAASVGQFIPPAFVGWLALGAAASLVSRPAADIYVTSLVAYATLVLWSSIRLALRYGWRELVAAPLVYFLMHAGLGSGFWAEAANSMWRKPPEVSESKSLSTLENAARRSPDSGV